MVGTYRLAETARSTDADSASTVIDIDFGSAKARAPAVRPGHQLQRHRHAPPAARHHQRRQTW